MELVEKEKRDYALAAQLKSVAREPSAFLSIIKASTVLGN